MSIIGLMKKLSETSSSKKTIFQELRRRFADLSMVKRMNDLYDESSENENMLDVMVPYADLMTLLLVFFVFFFIVSDFKKSRVIKQQRMQLQKIAMIDSTADLNEKVITIPGEVLFESGKAELKFNSLRTLALIARNIERQINNEKGWQIRVEGHTDNVPIHNKRYKSNWELSTARALSVVEFFVENGYFSPDQMQAMGYGEFKPVAPNDTPENRKKNRRVEIRVYKEYRIKTNG